MLVISQRSASDRVKRVEPPDRLELVLEIAEHEADEPFRFAPLLARFVTGLDSGHRKRARHRHSGKRSRSEPGKLAMAAGLLALDQIVEPDAEHPRDQLEEGKTPTLGALAEVGCKWLRALGRRPAPAIVS